MRTHTLPLAPSCAAAILLAATFLSGCVTKDDRTAGVDEFPNSIYARVNAFLEEGKKSEAVNPAPALTDSLIVDGGFHLGGNLVSGRKVAGSGITGPEMAAGKLAAAAERASQSGLLRGLAKAGAESGCTSGVFTVMDTVKTDTAMTSSKSTVNTISICLDAKALDSIKGNENVVHIRSMTTYGSGRVETADISDADGDGILNPRNAASKLGMVFTASEKGVSERTSLLVGPGPDADFDTEADNLVYAASWIKTSGNDTLGTAVYTDADSDGVAIDNGKASVVDLDFYQKGPSAEHPDAVWSKAKMRLVVRYRVEAKEARRVRFEMEDRAGRLEMGEVLNARGGIDFDMRDTVQAHFLSVSTAASDTLDSSDVRLVMSLGKDFDSKKDDSVYSMTVRTTRKLGEEKAARFSFSSDKPMPSGKDPVSGTLSMRVEYADATSLTVDGTLEAGGLDVVIEDRAGKRWHVVWDREGRGISQQELR